MGVIERPPDALAGIDAAARRCGLAVRGAFHPAQTDEAPEGCGTLVLFGPADGLWPIFRASPEFVDPVADPLDRWSRRVIGGLARAFAAEPLFPFGGPPYLPFIAWARRSGRAWTSPVGLLVHDEAGLFISYRGALALRHRLDLPAPGVRPCETCAAPCLTACPVAALTGAGYDLPRCHAYLDTGPGRDCLDRGCAVRRACPVGGGISPARAAFHMAAFHGKRRR
jgi:epoxyqueuosine reductase